MTIGADVAITSVICQRLCTQFKDVQIVVFGDAKLKQIFAANPRIRIRELAYSRRGGLVERFLVWLDLLALVNDELGALPAEKYLLFDPDSRLTQLGVLPLVADARYCFFNSRGKSGYPSMATISQLCNIWLDKILGPMALTHPRVWLDPSTIQTAGKMLERIDPDSKCYFITLNLGVGGNLRKRVNEAFEAALVLSLLIEPNVVVLLDMGFGEEERRRSEKIIAVIEAAGHKAQITRFGTDSELHGDTRLLGVESNVGEIASLIAHSKEFIGYDSACQHIAAALGIKTFTVFAGTNNARFICRWHASGPNTSEIVYVDTLSKEYRVDIAELIGRLNDLRLH